jgi:signal transduction histidine kinase
MVSTLRRRLPALGALRDEFISPFLRGAVIALVLALLLAVWIAQWVASPLRNMTDAARDVASGEFYQIEVAGPGEVKTLANAFNEMVDRVQSSQRSQRDFIANVSHDLKTPLTSIQGFAQAILDGTAGEPDSLRQSAQVIFDEAGRMNRMVLDLLELARLDSGMEGFEKTKVAIRPLLEGVLENFTLLARSREVSLKLICEHNLPEIIGDPDRLTQVFTNILDNALKYTPSGGQVQLSAKYLDSMLEVSVMDSGPGIPAADINRLFERFYQTDKSRPGGEGRGFGLGLAIAREIVLAHGGVISAYNKESYNPSHSAGMTGTGSVFVVKLPVQSLTSSQYRI